MDFDYFIAYINKNIYHSDSNNINKFDVTFDKSLFENNNSMCFANSHLLNIKNLYDIQDIIQLYNIKRPRIYDYDRKFIRRFNNITKKINAYKRSYELLGVNLNQLEIEKCLPITTLREFIGCRLEFMNFFIKYCKSNETDLSYYKNHFIKHKHALNNLGAIHMSKESLAFACLLNKNMASLAKKVRYLDHKNELLFPIRYNNLSTKTGRLIVSSGLNILTLPKNYRYLVKSKFQGGKIISIDFKAIEPTIILSLMGGDGDLGVGDLYGNIAKLANNKNVDRDVIKKIFLPFIYGASLERIVELSGICKSDVKRVSDIININFNKNKILSKINIKDYGYDNKVLYNEYGRPISLQNNMQKYKNINYYAQSTGVDVVLDALYKILKLKKEKEYKSECVAIIHDDLLFDVHPNEEQKFIDDVVSIMTNNNIINNKMNVSIREIL
jgi:hypothetical protein